MASRVASSASQFTITPIGGSNTTGAFHEPNSLACAAASVTGGGQTGMHGPHAWVHVLSMPYQSCCGTEETGPTTVSNPSWSALEKILPPSFKCARQMAALLRPANSLPPCQFRAGVNPTSAEVVGEEKGLDLHALAKWLRLHDPAHPSPTVGDLESDPCGIADRYGVKGQSVLTAFIDMVDLSCRVCAFKAKTLQLAVLHQQQKRHLQL